MRLDPFYEISCAEKRYDIKRLFGATGSFIFCIDQLCGCDEPGLNNDIGRDRLVHLPAYIDSPAVGRPADIATRALTDASPKVIFQRVIVDQDQV